MDVARANCRANHVSEQITCLEATGFDHPDLNAAAPFDLIFANILMGPLIDLAPNVAKHTAPRGFVILSGLLTEQVDDVLSVYFNNGFKLLNNDTWGEWAALTLQLSEKSSNRLKN